MSGPGSSCLWCERPIPERDADSGKRIRSDATTCSKACRQSRYRARRRGAANGTMRSPASSRPMRFAYADPPYPGMSYRYYRDQPSYAGEVDHEDLINGLEWRRGTFDTGDPDSVGHPRIDGWALSTSAAALRDVLPLCPPEARVCVWVKPIGASTRTFGLHNTWEPVIVVGERRTRPGRRDWLSAQPARGEGDLPGRKPVAFCTWLFGLLGMQPGDTLEDLYPGTGIVSRTWAELERDAEKSPPGERR